MAKQVFTDFNFNGGAKVTGLPTPTAATDAATKGYADSLIEGLAWKDDVVVSTQANINLASPGTAIDGVTMAVGDRVLVRAQTGATENGIYIWNGSATAMGRAPDANASAEFNNAVVSVNSGTSAGTTWRCTTLNPVLGTDAITFTSFVAGAPPASETTAGIAEIATQAETDAGTDDLRMVTPLKLASWAGRVRKFAASIGDGTATQYDVTHNLGTLDVQVTVYRNSSPYDEVIVDVQRLSVNAVRLVFAGAPTLNQYRAVVMG